MLVWNPIALASGCLGPGALGPVLGTHGNTTRNSSLPNWLYWTWPWPRLYTKSLLKLVGPNPMKSNPSIKHISNRTHNMVAESKQSIAGLAELGWLRQGGIRCLINPSPAWTRQSGATGHLLSQWGTRAHSHMAPQSTEYHHWPDHFLCLCFMKDSWL